MEVHINDINSMVHITDEQEILNPALLQQIVQAVLVRLRQEQKLGQYIENECNLDLQRQLIGSTEDWR